MFEGLEPSESPETSRAEIGPRSFGTFEKQPLDISPLKRTKRNPQGYMPRDNEGFQQTFKNKYQRQKS